MLPFFGGGGRGGGGGGKSENVSSMHKIHTQGGFFASTPNQDFCDSQSERFLGKDLKKVFVTSGF